jgi:hypothetical protein
LPEAKRKSEIRNSKPETISKSEMSEMRNVQNSHWFATRNFGFWVSDFFRPSDLGHRIS